MENLMIICTSITTNHSVGELIMVIVGVVVIGGIVASLMILTMETFASLTETIWHYFRKDFAWDVVMAGKDIRLWYVRHVKLPFRSLKRKIRKNY